MMQFMVDVAGISFYLPARTCTPSLRRRMLQNFGQQVSRSSWISPHRKTCSPGNIFEDSPTITQSSLPYSSSCSVENVSASGSSLGMNSYPKGQKQWSQAWQMKQVLGLLRPSTSPLLALCSSLCRLFSELVLQNMQERPLPPQILQRRRYQRRRVSLPVKQPKSTESMYSCSVLSLNSLSTLVVLSPKAMLFYDFSVSYPVFLNFFLIPSSIEPLPIRLSFSMACYTQMGSR